MSTKKISPSSPYSCVFAYSRNASPDEKTRSCVFRNASAVSLILSRIISCICLSSSTITIFSMCLLLQQKIVLIIVDIVENCFSILYLQAESMLPQSVFPVFYKLSPAMIQGDPLLLFCHLADDIIHRITDSHRMPGRIPSSKQTVDSCFVDDDLFAEMSPKLLSHLPVRFQQAEDLFRLIFYIVV